MITKTGAHRGAESGWSPKKASHRWWVRNKLHYPAISPEQGASKIVKISQQMAKLCRKLNWLVFFWDTVYISNEFGFYTSLPQTCVRFFGWEMSGIWKITWWKARKGPASRGRWAEKCPSVLLLGVNANDVSDEFFHLKIVCTLHDSATKYKLRPMARLFAYGSCKIKCIVFGGGLNCLSAFYSCWLTIHCFYDVSDPL